MDYNMDGPIDAIRSRRRASTAGSTGLDYRTGLLIDEDISSRIRSLLVSRNTRYPPRTPHPSDEQPAGGPTESNPLLTFDFSTATSIRKAVQETGRPSLPATFRRALARSEQSVGSGRKSNAEAPFFSSVASIRSLRSASSANELKPPNTEPSQYKPSGNDLPSDIPEASETERSAFSSPGESKKRFRLPRLTLLDKKPRNKTEIKSCIEITPNSPPNDGHIHQTEMQCCPPCNPEGSKPSKYTYSEWPYRAIKANPSDLACFLAGCPPDETDCKKHSSRRESIVTRTSVTTEDLKSAAEKLSRDAAEIGIRLSIQGLASGLKQDFTKRREYRPKGDGAQSSGSSKPGYLLSETQDADVQKNIDILSGARQKNVDAVSPKSSIMRTKTDLLVVPEDQGDEPTDPLTRSAIIQKIDTSTSPRESVSSNLSDAFPHAAQSMALVNKSKDAFLSTIITTNFSLPGYKDRKKSRKDSTKPKPVEALSSPPKETNTACLLPPKETSQPPPSITMRAPTAIEESLPRPPIPESSATANEPKQTITGRTSDSSLISKPRSPKTASLLTDGSRGSTRHSLLKPSISEATPVDTGLPVPPKLSPIYSVSEKDPAYVTDSSEGAGTTAKDKLISTESCLRVPRPLTSDDEWIGEPQNVRAYSQHMIRCLDLENEATHRCYSTPSPTAPIATSQTPIWGQGIKPSPISTNVEVPDSEDPPNGSSTLDQPAVTQENNETCAWPPKAATDKLSISQAQSNVPQADSQAGALPPRVTADTLSLPQPQSKRRSVLDQISRDSQPVGRKRGISSPPKAILTPESKEKDSSKVFTPVEPEDMANAAYWGFVPEVRDEIQDAVQHAVINAVQDVVVPRGAEKEVASVAYRRLVARSLNDAAKQADDWLRRPSLWLEEPESPTESEATVITPGRALRGIQRDYGLVPPQSRQLKVRDGAQSTPGTTGNQDFQTRENLVMRPSSPEEMETVPLDLMDKPLLDKQPILKPWARGGYTGIPTRGSSRRYVLSSTKPVANPSEKVPPKVRTQLRPLKRSYERLAPRGTRNLRSTSSAEPLREAELVKEAYPKRIRDLRKDRSSSYQNQPEGNSARKNTIQWLKDVLSSSGAYEPRFTELPPRSRRDQNSSTGRIRSKTAPAKPVSQLYLGATPEPAVRKPEPVAAVDEKNPSASEAFTRTINDLEHLMNEALNIAKQATTTQDAPHVPVLLEGATNVLKCGKRGDENDIRDHVQRRHIDRRAYPTQCSNGSSELASVHESLLSYTASEDFESEDAEQYAVTKSGAPVAYKKVNAKATTGLSRVERPRTPFGLASPAQSEKDYEEALEPIKAADPRTLPLVSNLETTKPKKRTPTPPRVLPYAPDDMSEIIRTEFSKPKFRTTEPFNPELDPVRDPEETRSIKAFSDKSPKRLSPTRVRTQVETGEIAGEIDPAPRRPLPRLTKPGLGASPKCIEKSHSQEDHERLKSRLANKSVPGKKEVRAFILENGHPPIHPRTSSGNLRKAAKKPTEKPKVTTRRKRKRSGSYSWQDIDQDKFQQATSANNLETQNPRGQSHSYDGSQITQSEEIDFSVGYGVRQRGGGNEGGEKPAEPPVGVELKDSPDPNLPETTKNGQSPGKKVHPAFSLRGKNHVSLNEHHKGFSLARSHKKQKIARDWSPGRKRFVATVSCISTALVGILVGIYAGETPAIQYYIVDLHHYTVLGNVFFFVGLAIPTFFFWPLPLLHGRKPYILGSMALAMPLLFPQALAVTTFRSPNVVYWRIGLILPRAFMGFCLGFANMNFKSMLTDLFGASLQSTNPHQEHVDEFDVRRHGGGMGVWLGLWTWSALGSIGFGFMIGALIINHLPPAWGFYVSITIIAFVMLLNVLCPEPRRNAFRKSVAEVLKGDEVSRRLARGEVKMHMVYTGPKWWGEEFHYGVMLSTKMLLQPGFMVMAVYVAWIYGQMVLNIVLLGALTSKDYKFTSNYVGASVMAIPIGAAVAIPFQKASFFSRARQIAPVGTDGKTPKKGVTWTSHMVRRSIFILVLPFAGLGYTLCSSGPPIPFILPILFAGLIGFLSNLALAECHGIIMETFDTSDLQPGMTGRPRGSKGNKSASKRTNYSSFPRVTSAFGIVQSLGYLVGAAATGVGGVLTRHLGTQAATGTMAGVLLILSLMLLAVLVRFTDVQIIPEHKKEEMARYHQARRASQIRAAEGIVEEEPWRPIIIGNPHHETRRMCLLEMGGMTRFSEIRKKNKLVDENSLEAKHPDRAALLKFEQRIKEKEQEIVGNVRRSFSRGSRESRKAGRSDPEQGDLGGFREMGGGLRRGPSGNADGQRGTNLSRRRIAEGQEQEGQEGG